MIHFIVLMVTVFFYVLSLFLPAILFHSHDSLPGYHILAWGWWGVLSLNFAWFANPCYLFSMYYYHSKNYKLAGILSLVAVCLALMSLLAKKWWFNEGNSTAIAGLGSGFYIWFVSLLILFSGSAYLFWLYNPNIMINAKAQSRQGHNS